MKLVIQKEDGVYIINTKKCSHINLYYNYSTDDSNQHVHMYIFFNSTLVEIGSFDMKLEQSEIEEALYGFCNGIVLKILSSFEEDDFLNLTKEFEYFAKCQFKKEGEKDVKSNESTRR